MPTSSRSWRRFTALRSLTVWPHAVISPPSITSNRSMQRSAVLLPEPLRPMIAVTSPRPTSNDTPSSTFSGPKLLRTSRRLTTVLPAAAAMAARARLSRKPPRRSSRRLQREIG